jgi:hypothetical protein
MLTSTAHRTGIEQVRALERRRIEATRINDADALAPLLHDSLIYVNSVGSIYDKTAYLRDIRTHALTYDRDFDVRETEARVLDDIIILVGQPGVHGPGRRDPDLTRERSPDGRHQMGGSEARDPRATDCWSKT